MLLLLLLSGSAGITAIVGVDVADGVADDVGSAGTADTADVAVQRTPRDVLERVADRNLASRFFDRRRRGCRKNSKNAILSSCPRLGGWRS